MKILIIGQAPPAVIQSLPYDTTMLYKWLEECGISKGDSQKMFEFEAVYNIFPGKDENGHLKPTDEQMTTHWENTLKAKVQNAEKIWVFGSVAREFLKDKLTNKKVLSTIHPSKRNSFYYNNNKEAIIRDIKNFLNN